MAQKTMNAFVLSVIFLLMLPMSLNAEPACCGQVEDTAKTKDDPKDAVTTVVCYAYATGPYGPMVMPGSATGDESKCNADAGLTGCTGLNLVECAKKRADDAVKAIPGYTVQEYTFTCGLCTTGDCEQTALVKKKGWTATYTIKCGQGPVHTGDIRAKKPEAARMLALAVASAESAKLCKGNEKVSWVHVDVTKD